MMLGEMRLEREMYRAREPTLAGELSPERLPARKSSPSRRRCLIPTESSAARRPHVAADAAVTGVKDGAFAERDGVIVVRNGDHFEPAPGSSSAARVRGMMAVRDAVRLVFQTQLDDAPEDRIIEARQLLNELLRFLCPQGFGPLSSRENVKAFAGDPDQPLLLSLENYDPETEARCQDRHLRAPHAGTLPPGRTRRDAPPKRWPSRSTKPASIDWPRMEQLTGRSAGSCSANLAASSIAIPKAATGKPPTGI